MLKNRLVHTQFIKNNEGVRGWIWRNWKKVYCYTVIGAELILPFIPFSLSLEDMRCPKMVCVLTTKKGVDRFDHWIRLGVMRVFWLIIETESCSLFFVGFLRDVSGSYIASLYGAAGVMFLSLILCLISMLLHSRIKTVYKNAKVAEAGVVVFTVTRF